MNPGPGSDGLPPKATGEPVGANPTRADIAAHLAAHSRELAVLARNADMPLAALCLDMAYLEASSIRDAEHDGERA